MIFEPKCAILSQAHCFYAFHPYVNVGSQALLQICDNFATFCRATNRKKGEKRDSSNAAVCPQSVVPSCNLKLKKFPGVTTTIHVCKYMFRSNSLSLGSVLRNKFSSLTLTRPEKRFHVRTDPWPCGNVASQALLQICDNFALVSVAFALIHAVALSCCGERPRLPCTSNPRLGQQRHEDAFQNRSHAGQYEGTGGVRLCNAHKFPCAAMI
jgi:hypothetical protein